MNIGWNQIAMSARAMYIVSLIIMPSYFYYLGFRVDIVPAVDVCILYYLSTYTKIRHISLFLIGILLDSSHNIPIGTSSLALITASYLLAFSHGLILIKKYYANALIFTAYCTYILLLRYVFVSFWNDQQVDTLCLVFHILTTIFVYPIVKLLIEITLPLRKDNKELDAR